MCGFLFHMESMILGNPVLVAVKFELQDCPTCSDVNTMHKKKDMDVNTMHKKKDMVTQIYEILVMEHIGD